MGLLPHIPIVLKAAYKLLREGIVQIRRELTEIIDRRYISWSQHMG